MPQTYTPNNTNNPATAWRAGHRLGWVIDGEMSATPADRWEDLRRMAPAFTQHVERLLADGASFVIVERATGMTLPLDVTEERVGVWN